MLNSIFGISQKIDYANFDSKRASEVLAETFLNFRDTITYHHLKLAGYKISDISPEMNTCPSLRKLRWSDWLYTNLSVKNCSEIRLMYTENLYQHTGQFETYQDMAISIIETWDKSELHSAIMRSKNFSNIEYKDNKVIMTALFSCSIQYNPSTKYTKAALNIIDVT
jgi:hypothetical protein